MTVVGADSNGERVNREIERWREREREMRTESNDRMEVQKLARTDAWRQEEQHIWLKLNEASQQRKLRFTTTCKIDPN